jgi:hypothetical protein
MGQITDNLQINGQLSATSMVIPPGSLTDAGVNASAKIAATKLQHQHRVPFAQPSATTASSVTQVLHSVYGATAIAIAFRAGCIVPCVGAATITVDLKKNGASILSAPISLGSANAIRQLIAGTITSPNLVVNDVLEMVVVATAGGGTIGQGLFVELTVNEDPA